MDFLLAIIFFAGIIGMIRFAITDGIALILYATTRVLILPFLPFVSAFRNYKDNPKASTVVFVLWSIIYTLILFAAWLSYQPC